MSGRLAKARRIVIKIGSALLVDSGSGQLRRKWLGGLAQDIAALKADGKEVLIVSSGAIALGRRTIGRTGPRLKLEEKQAAAAIGQIKLAHAYEEALAAHDINVAQALLTLGDTEERRRYLNARSTFMTLLRFGVVPVINENDTVATSEIRYGDNDRLAARVAQMVSADCLVLLSDVEGLFESDPTVDPDARIVPEIHVIDAAVMAMAGVARSDAGTGGMVTKLKAAEIAIDNGCNMLIAQGNRERPLRAIIEGARCSWFLAHKSPRAARKQWIASALKPAGAIVIDDGAVTALASGKSLLPAGVVSVSGDFQRGDPVAVLTLQGRELGRGLSAYSRDDAARIAGHKSREIETLLGYSGRTELIHRDDLALV
ncbi:glutamate 5-kinase [Oceanibacterium hippocampi]|uniref:Glutamate 5-kinase n=1 Tax=Oceanibacterium hippocampi TaxID=745714 RepID=A0A1Y5REZ3_9PROT|nr:glutamate 5-kinase [Oceanibacterium hippocampi]SLN13292.1 Glutamate 5-kinase [Oceanibacterium hippocampi]